MSDVAVKDSPLHGKGVFAARSFKKGDVVISWENTRVISSAAYNALPASDRHYIDVQDGKILLLGSPERYVNHSCDPNTIPGQQTDIAARNIAAGEEITTDYKDYFIPEGRFHCTCGSARCRGVVVGQTSTSSPVLKPAP